MFILYSWHFYFSSFFPWKFFSKIFLVFSFIFKIFCRILNSHLKKFFPLLFSMNFPWKSVLYITICTFFPHFPWYFFIFYQYFPLKKSKRIIFFFYFVTVIVFSHVVVKCYSIEKWIFSCFSTIYISHFFRITRFSSLFSCNFSSLSKILLLRKLLF